jgi:hypothetical protein
MSRSPWLSPTVTDGQRDYDALVIANNCTTVLHGNMLACLQDIPFDTFMATVNRMADLFSYTPLTPLAPACQWGCDPVQPVPVHCAWCICEGVLFRLLICFLFILAFFNRRLSLCRG